MSESPLNEQMLIELAGTAAFRRGQAYFQDGRVTLTSRSKDGFRGLAEGSTTYRLVARGIHAQMDWACTCPAAADGDFCKHLVAAALVWHQDHSGSSGEDAPLSLTSRLQALDQSTLAEWLSEAAECDPKLASKLQLRLANDSEGVHRVLDMVLTERGYLGWRESVAFADELDAPLERLDELLGSSPIECLELTESAIKRLLGIYAQADDSGGSIGMALEKFANLHYRSARSAKIDGTRLARRLLELKRQEDWHLFPLEQYWKLLGKKGQALYTELVKEEFNALGPAVPRAERDLSVDNGFYVVERRKELARLQDDFETLECILARDLSYPNSYIRLIKLADEYGHKDHAMQWAKRGLKTHPDSPDILTAAAGQLRAVGFEKEAIGLLWRAFRIRPGLEQWTNLKQTTDDAWPEWRQKALDELAAREQKSEGTSDCTRRIELLMHDGDLESAQELAEQSHVRSTVLRSLAAQLKPTHPRQAADFIKRYIDAELPSANAKSYNQFVPTIKEAFRLDPGQPTKCWIDGIRQQYKARRKLMRLMDEAGLP